MIKGLAVNQVYLATGFTDMRKSINGLSNDSLAIAVYALA
jgi:hypothetical protein